MGYFRGFLTPHSICMWAQQLEKHSRLFLRRTHDVTMWKCCSELWGKSVICMWDNLQVAFLFCHGEIKGQISVVSVSADRSRPRGFSTRFMFKSSSKQWVNQSRANYTAPNTHITAAKPIEFFLQLHVWQKYEGCKASWISFMDVVFVCVASGFTNDSR